MRDDSETPPLEKQDRDKWRIQAWIYDKNQDSRIRNCEYAVRGTEGYLDFSDFIVELVMEGVERHEKELNGGKPFPPPPASARPGRGRGRPPRTGTAVE